MMHRGQLVGGVCMICGIFVLGLPIVVVGNTFDEVFKEEEDEVARAKEAAKRLELAAANETENPLEVRAPLSSDPRLQSTPLLPVDVSTRCNVTVNPRCPCCDPIMPQPEQEVQP